MTEKTKKELCVLLENIRANESGSTLKKYMPVHYSSGYQFSTTRNSETNMAETVTDAVKMIETLKGNCGVWFYDGLFYVESSDYTESYEIAVRTAYIFDQISIYDWKNDAYIDVKTAFEESFKN